LNICIFSDTYSPQVNGVVTSIITLKEGLIAQGHKVYIVTVNSEKLKTTINDDEIRISAIKLKKFDGHCLATSLNTKVLKQLREWDIDLIHTQTEFVVGTIGRIYAKRAHIPLVHTYHTLYEDYMHYVTSGLFDKQARMMARHVTKYICNFSKEVIVPTPKIAKLLRKYRVKSNIYTLPTGVDLRKFFKNNFTQQHLLDFKVDLGFKEDDFLITYIGRLAKEKDIDKIISGFSQVQEELPGAKLVIIGDGPARKELEEQAKELKVKGVYFLGKVPWVDIPVYYNISDVFVTASKSETQGLTVLEALAASTPVVCVDDPSFDVVEHDYNGMKFETASDLAHCIRFVYNNPAHLNYLSGNAFESIQDLDINIFINNAVNIYDKVITNKKKRDEVKKLKYRFWRKKNEK